MVNMSTIKKASVLADIAMILGDQAENISEIDLSNSDGPVFKWYDHRYIATMGEDENMTVRILDEHHQPLRSEVNHLFTTLFRVCQRRPTK